MIQRKVAVKGFNMKDTAIIIVISIILYSNYNDLDISNDFFIF